MQTLQELYKMKRIFLMLIFVFMCLQPLCSQEHSCRRFDFSDNLLLKKQWHWRGKQFGIPMTKFSIKESNSALDRKILLLEANCSTGVIVTQIPAAVWQKYPVMRWRWRILKKVDIKGKDVDDQAAVIYFGDGTVLKQNMVAYSWENLLPLGANTFVDYGMGSRKIFRIAVRNNKAGLSQWYEEERNVVEDFKKAFGRAPEGRCGLTIGANSQYSQSKTMVEIDFIEFCEAPKKVSSPAGDGRKIAERRTQK